MEWINNGHRKMIIKTGYEVVGKYDENWEPRHSVKKQCNTDKWIAIDKLIFDLIELNNIKELTNCIFTSSQKEMIVSALMESEADGCFDTAKSKEDYELIFDQLDGKRALQSETTVKK